MKQTARHPSDEFIDMKITQISQRPTPGFRGKFVAPPQDGEDGVIDIVLTIPWDVDLVDAAVKIRSNLRETILSLLESNHYSTQPPATE